MSEREQHRERWSDDIAAYALGALGEREAALLEHHLDGCESCKAELRWLQPAVDAIPASVEQLTPPPALRERLLTVVREEAEPAAEPRPAKTARRFRLPYLGSVALRPALAGAAVLLLAAGVAGYELRNTTEDSGSGAPASATYAAKVPGTPVRGTLEVEGDKGYLHIENMPANRPNQVYQAWVQDPATGSAGKPEVHPSSVFVVNQGGTGEVMIPHGLDDAAKVMITREPKGGSELPSEPAMMTVNLG